MPRGVRDALKRVTKALPNGAAAVTTDAIDLEKGANGDHVAGCELLIEAPALTVGELANAATVKYDVVTSDNADLSAPTVVAKEVLTQTGADGAGAAASSVRFAFPTNVKRYVGVKATNSGAGNQSGKSVVASLVF